MEKTNQKQNYSTLSEAVNGLIKRGYTEDFLIMKQKGCLVCNESAIELSPEDFSIDEVYRFEGDSDPADESIVFAITSDKHNVKGLVVNGYGADFDPKSSELVAHLHKHL